MKSSSLVNPANITTFLTPANKEILRALRNLEREREREREKQSKQAFQHVYGLLSGFIVCTTGHRKGVISNLLVEFIQAEEDKTEQRFIWVKEHKTKRAVAKVLCDSIVGEQRHNTG